MTIEDLRGQEFIHRDDESTIHVVGRSRDGRCVIHWKNKADTTVYRDDQVVDFFKRDVWVKIE